MFVIDGRQVRKTLVTVDVPDKLDTGSQLRIEPVDQEAFEEGTQVAVAGVHFLNDGDEVVIVTADQSPGVGP